MTLDLCDYCSDNPRIFFGETARKGLASEAREVGRLAAQPPVGAFPFLRAYFGPFPTNREPQPAGAMC
jgi:hypothetical protein